MKRKIIINNDEIEIDILSNSQKHVEFTFDGEKYSYQKVIKENNKLYLKNNNRMLCSEVYKNGNTTDIILNGDIATVSKAGANSRKTNIELGEMVSPMPGKILKVSVKVGELVKKGSEVVIIEAMKMEHSVKAVKEGIVEDIFYKDGDLVDGGVELLSIKDSE